MHSAGPHKLCPDAFDVPGIDVFHKRAGKTVLHAEQNADRFHSALPSEYAAESALVRRRWYARLQCTSDHD